VFGPKIIATRRDFLDPALESRCITEVMTGVRPRGSVPLTLPESFQDDARSLRNQLLWYRFTHRNRRQDLGLNEFLGVEPRIAQVLAPLYAIASDTAARRRII